MPKNATQSPQVFLFHFDRDTFKLSSIIEIDAPISDVAKALRTSVEDILGMVHVTPAGADALRSNFGVVADSNFFHAFVGTDSGRLSSDVIEHGYCQTVR